MKQISNVNQVKNHNVALIKNTLKSIESGTKNTVSQLTGLSVATCNTILNELASTGEIIETASAAPTIGRPPKSYRFNESFAYVLCLFTFEEGEFTLNSAVTDLLGTIITDDTKSYSKITTKDILEYIAEKIEEEPRIKYISLGISGFYYNKKVQQSGITDINGVDLKSVIENEFGLPCTIENDTNAMAFGVYSFSDKMAECREENKSVALLAYFKGRSPGCGIIIDGRIHLGNTRFSGEVSNLVFKTISRRSDLRTDLGVFVDEYENPFPASHVLESAYTCVVALTCTVNPDTVVFTGEAMNDDMLVDIRKETGKYIPCEHLPHLVYGSDVRKYYFWGLCAEALNEDI